MVGLVEGELQLVDNNLSLLVMEMSSCVHQVDLRYWSILLFFVRFTELALVLIDENLFKLESKLQNF